MRKILFSLFLFLLICSTASAFEDTVERYPTGAYNDYWTYSTDRLNPTYGHWDTSDLSISVNPILPGNSALKLYSRMYQSAGYKSSYFTHSLTTKTVVSDQYISVTVPNISYTLTGGASLTNSELIMTYKNSADSSTLCTVSIPVTQGHKYEFLKTGMTTISVYDNGVKYSDTTYISNTAGTVYLTLSGKVSAYGAGSSELKYSLYIDDITTSSCIGLPETINEGQSTLPFTWSTQLMGSYTDTYKITLYSLSNPSNAGSIKSWIIPTEDNSSTLEHGYIIGSRSSLMGENFGLYMLEMTRGDDILTDQYFYYYQSSSPQGLPELLFLGEADVNTEIRDENNNGGEIDGGGSVYLYPDIQADGTYNFTYEILETPYAISTELTDIYNNTAIISTTINYSGLSNQNYKISVDGAEVGSTNGADTYSYTFSDWSTETNHIISFAPDYTLAGVWGEVKNSETQEGIKSATVSVSGENFSKTIYTDDNGLFYLTKGLEAGKTYTISVSKTGYSTPPQQTAVTVEGSTTRQDFYMDKLSTTGSGLYYAPHDVGFTVLEYWYSGAGLTGVTYAIYNGTESIKTGTTDSKGMFTGSDMSGGTNYTIILTHNGTTYTEYVEPSLTEYTFVLNKEGILHQYVNSWLNLTYTENSQNVTIAYSSNKTITGASLTVIAGNGTTVYTQTLSTDTGSFTFETGGEGDYTLNFHIEATDGSTASQSWGLSYPDKIPLFPDSYPAWLKNVLFSGIIMVFLLAFGKSKNDLACGAVAILTSMGYMFEWFTGSFYFVVLVWIIALGAVFLHYKRTGGVG